MSGELYLELAWLPPAPADFAASCRELASGRAAQALASHRLDGNQLSRLGRAITRELAAGRDLAPLLPFRLGLIGNGTLDMLVPMLVASAARHGLALHCVQAPFGQTTQEALDPRGTVNSANPDAVLLAIDHRGLPLQCVPGTADTEAEDVQRGLRALDTIREGIRRNCGAVCLVQTVPPPPETLFGSLERLVPGTPTRVIERLNQVLGDGVAGSGDLLLDVATLAGTVGLATWHAPELWNMAKQSCAQNCLPIYAEHVARLLGAMRGRSRKCLILDLDNTVWGGVIGDDGLEGIKVAQGDATGEAHLAVQRMALDLRRRGIVLAVSSKNTDDIARQPFRDHPEMLLREDHFAVFQANWNDKATNIAAIATELSLGLDAMVFLDDNPVERGLVRQALPQVAVPELPDDPARYARILAAAGYFEATAFSDEDRTRAEMYQFNARRVALRSQAGDLDSYLLSLDMEAVFAPFDRTGRARIAQLINKSNQFNLTTRRYTEAEVAEAEHDPAVFTLQVRLVDSFGDNGMICVVVCRPGESGNWPPGTWVIDTWLMSCRVLGRKVEQAVLREIVAAAREAGIGTLVGTYRPTPKNALVRDHYARLGFEPAGEQADGTTHWTLPAATTLPDVPMRTRWALPAMAAA